MQWHNLRAHTVGPTVRICTAAELKPALRSSVGKLGHEGSTSNARDLFAPYVAGILTRQSERSRTMRNVLVARIL